MYTCIMSSASGGLLFPKLGTNPSASIKSNKKAVSTGEYKTIMVSAAKPASRPWDAFPDGSEEDPYRSVGGDASVIVADGETSYQAQTGHSDAPEDLDAIARQAGLDDSAVSALLSLVLHHILTRNRCVSSMVAVADRMHRSTYLRLVLTRSIIIMN